MASHTSKAAGIKAFTSASRRAKRASISRPVGGPTLGFAPSILDIEIHPGVEAPHLVGVAVEHQGLTPPRLSDPLLGGLTPSWMIVMWINIRVEAVLLGCMATPCRRRFVLRQCNLNDRFDSLESVFPG